MANGDIGLIKFENPYILLKELVEANFDNFEPWDFNPELKNDNRYKRMPKIKVSEVFNKIDSFFILIEKIAAELTSHNKKTFSSNEVNSTDLSLMPAAPPVPTPQGMPEKFDFEKLYFQKELEEALNLLSNDQYVKGRLSNLFDAKETQTSLLLTSGLSNLTNQISLKMLEADAISRKLLALKDEGASEEFNSLEQRLIDVQKERVRLIEDLKQPEFYPDFKDGLDRLNKHVETNLINSLVDLISYIASKYKVKFLRLSKEDQQKALEAGINFNVILKDSYAVIPDLADLISEGKQLISSISEVKKEIKELLKTKCLQETVVLKLLNDDKLTDFSDSRLLNNLVDSINDSSTGQLLRVYKRLFNPDKKAKNGFRGMDLDRLVAYKERLPIVKLMNLSADNFKRELSKTSLLTPSFVEELKETMSTYDFDYMDVNDVNKLCNLVENDRDARRGKGLTPIKVLFYGMELSLLNDLRRVITGLDRAIIEGRLNSNDVVIIKNLMSDQGLDYLSNKDVETFCLQNFEYKPKARKFIFPEPLFNKANYFEEKVKEQRVALEKQLDYFDIMNDLADRFLSIGRGIESIDPVLPRLLVAVDDLTDLAGFNELLDQWYGFNEGRLYAQDNSKELQKEFKERIAYYKKELNSFNEFINKDGAVNSLIKRTIKPIPLPE